MDFKMPILNGYDATKEIKKFRPELPIIAQTAYAMEGDKEKAKKAGCDEYITKPLNPDILISLIKKYRILPLASVLLNIIKILQNQKKY